MGGCEFFHISQEKYVKIHEETVGPAVCLYLFVVPEGEKLGDIFNAMSIHDSRRINTREEILTILLFTYFCFLTHKKKKTRLECSLYIKSCMQMYCVFICSRSWPNQKMPTDYIQLDTSHPENSKYVAKKPVWRVGQS